MSPQCRNAAGAAREEESYAAYAEAVVSEIESRRDEISESALFADTLYIGGGTPSVLPLSVFEKILSALSDSLSHKSNSFAEGSLSHLCDTPASLIAGSPFGSGLCHPVLHPRYSEFTVEVNPEDIVEKGIGYASGLRALGATRISMGIQSFDDGILHWMNRRHNSEGALKAFDILRAAGFDNISIDLIFGLSQLSDPIWADTLDKALSLHPEHISAYQLSIEIGSALSKLIARGRYTEASDDNCSRQYDILCQRLSASGYRHYEISNFAIPGYEARHNSAYWRRIPYIGLGPGAHSLCFTRPFASIQPVDPDPSSPSVKSPDPDPSFPSVKSPDPDPSSPSVKSLDQGQPSRPLGSDLPQPDKRSWNPPDLTAYLNRTSIPESEQLSETEIVEEQIMLALRTDTGISETFLRSHCDNSLIDRLLYEALLVPITPIASVPPTVTPIPTASGVSTIQTAPVTTITSTAPNCLNTSDTSSDSPFLRIPESRFFVSDDIISDLLV